MNDKLAEHNKATRFSSENQPANPGRKKNRFKEIKKDYELSIDDMKQVLDDVLSMTLPELKELAKDETQPVFKLVIASAVAGALQSKNWTQVNQMMDRKFGRPKEMIDLETPKGLKIIIEDPEKNE